MGSNAIGPHFLGNILDYVYHVTSDGVVTVSPSGVVTSVCKMDPKNFPYDCQSCSLRMDYGPISNDYIKLDVSAYHDRAFITTESKIWSVLSISLDIPEKSADIVFSVEIVMQRKPNYYVVMIGFPSILLSVMAVAVYFIPVEEGERIGCGMTILLAFTVFLTQMADHLPENSESMPIIGLYFLMVMTSSTLVIIDSIIMSNRPPPCSAKGDNDEREITREDSSRTDARKKICKINAWLFCHYCLGGICLLVTAIAHILLFAKSLSQSCDFDELL
ncbi:neuronal acetylcholine receptor subunit beta-2-like [Argopecten irradians]|uniref:neuronal acetylcholine receptor subunit beta-2-like n=1 Tax=Argopecten irradians TaxID=31199 RepID=UPI003717B85E